MIRGRWDCPYCDGKGVIYYGHCNAMHEVACRCSYEKPHIRCGFLRPWKCEGGGRVASGRTPREAYEFWAAA